VPVAGGQAIQITRRGFAAFESQDGKTLYPVPFVQGLAVSPDERWFLYTQEDQRSSDIMLVENFR